MSPIERPTPDKPDHLPDHLSEIWDELVDQVHPRIGTAGMEALCGQVYRVRDAQRRVTEEGAVVADDKGNPVEHPALDIERRAQDQVRRWMKDFARPGHY